MHISDNAHGKSEGYRNARAKSVDAVSEVDRVYRGIDNDKAEDPEEYAHTNIAGKRNEHIGLLAHAHIERDEISDYNKRLKHRLLLLGQTEVAFFDNLYIVIGKADKRHAESKDNAAVELCIKLDYRRAGSAAVDDIAAEELVGNNSHRDCGYCAEDKHESAHGRRALLFLMPLRTDFKNSLPEMELSQPRNYGKPEQRGDERRGRRAHYQCCDSVHCFFLPVSCGSPRIFLTVSRSSSGNFSPPIS